MATSRVSLNGPDWSDVVATMEAFQTINNVEITLVGRVVDVSGLPTLQLLVEAHDKKHEIGDQSALAWVSATIGSHAHKTMEGAILWALYQLDWKLSEMKWGEDIVTA